MGMIEVKCSYEFVVDLMNVIVMDEFYVVYGNLFNMG